MRRQLNNSFVMEGWPQKKEGDGGSLKDGLSVKKPLRGPYEGVPARESSTDYCEPLTPKVEKNDNKKD